MEVLVVVAVEVVVADLPSIQHFYRRHLHANWIYTGLIEITSLISNYIYIVAAKERGTFYNITNFHISHL